MSAEKDNEGGVKKIPYPKSVLFIIICEFCERFCYYGMKTILTLYFVQVLTWSEDQATIIYHVYVMVSYFTPLIGAILADSLLGKFKTIFYLGLVYCIGCVVLTLAATPPLSIPTSTFSMVGLLLIAFGTGGIKPCVSAFGADQFKLPEQEVQVASYFALFYFAINSGSLVSTILTPILREDVKCFEEEHCYSLAFLIPGALMIFALTVFLLGRPMYVVKKPEGNVVLKVLKAIKRALSRKSSEVKAGRQREHWLDYADDEFDARFLAEAKVLLKVLFLYIPLPIFWTLYDQQGSRWTLQATRMNGDTFGVVIKPDQLQVVNPLLVLAFIPLFDRGIYPLLAKFGLLKKPLQKLATGLVFAGLAFTVSGIIELTLEGTYSIDLKSGESNLHMINTLPDCPLHITFAGEKVSILPNTMHIYERFPAGNYTGIKLETIKGDMECKTSLELVVNLQAENQVARSYMITYDARKKLKFTPVESEDELEKSDSGSPLMRIIYDPDSLPENTIIQGHNEKHVFKYDLSSNIGYTGFGEVEPAKFKVYLSNAQVPYGFAFKEELELKLGAVYILTVVRTEGRAGQVDSEENYKITLHQITKANNVHMLLQLPQYIIMTMGEIMFSITIMDFSYAESPPSMKSVLQSAWLLTVAFGNLVTIIVAEAKFFEKQSAEFFLFAGIQFADMLIFAYMAYTYAPTDRFWLRDNDKAEETKDGKDNAALEHTD